MKRDMELVRRILLALEEQESITGTNPTIDGYSDEQIAYHAYLIEQAGLANGSVVAQMESVCPEAIVTSLTWNGHEFLDLARNETSWRKAVTGLQKKTGSIAFGALKACLTEIAKEAAKAIAGHIAS